jgi:hypothetical protein
MKIPGFATLIRALDLWAERWRKREAAGDMIIVRYADNITNTRATPGAFLKCPPTEQNERVHVEF